MLIKGENLNENQRKQVLEAFIYRWTMDNERAREVYKEIKPPTMKMQTDKQWLDEHAFHFLQDGSRLMHNRHYAEPHYLAD